MKTVENATQNCTLTDAIAKAEDVGGNNNPASIGKLKQVEKYKKAKKDSGQALMEQLQE